MFSSRLTSASKQNPLIRAVAPFDHRSRRALYAASNEYELKRGTWDGCALNRAGTELGCVVTARAEAEEVFRADRRAIVDFVRTWDRLRCSDAQRSALLRDALLEVGLFPQSTAGLHRSDDGSPREPVGSNAG